MPAEFQLMYITAPNDPYKYFPEIFRKQFKVLIGSYKGVKSVLFIYIKSKYIPRFVFVYMFLRFSPGVPPIKRDVGYST